MDSSSTFFSGKSNPHLAMSIGESFSNEQLRRPRNFFLINLALADLGLLLTNNSMHTIASFKKQWIFGKIGKLVLGTITRFKLSQVDILY